VTHRARTVFLGTGAFAVPVLAALAEHPAVDLTAVVTAPQRTGSRGRPVDPPVAHWAAEHGLAMLRPTRLRAPESIAEIELLRPDLLVLADYGQIVPAPLLELAPHGALNLHPSLLPRHRGATPIPAAILAGDAETGVSLILMDAGLDTGAIVAQWRTALDGHETAPELEEVLATQAAELLSATLELWLAGRIEPEPQPAAGVTFTRLLSREDGRLDPERTAAELERQVRAYQPWPGSFVETVFGRLVVWRARPADERHSGVQVGVLVLTPDTGLALTTSDGQLALVEVQPAAGRRMTGAELLRGRPSLVGSHVVPPADPGAAL
jgi:methionyl-tRNA formyltransferase